MEFNQEIFINRQQIEQQMKLGSRGEAFFVRDGPPLDGSSAVSRVRLCLHETYFLILSCIARNLILTASSNLRGTDLVDVWFASPVTYDKPDVRTKIRRSGHQSGVK